MTNLEFSKTDDKFIAACAAVGLPRITHGINPTKSRRKMSNKTASPGYPSLSRQASKWKRGFGSAYKLHKETYKNELT